MKRFWTILIIAGIAYIAMSAFYYYTKPSTGDIAPNFSLKSVEGNTYTLDEFKGSPVLLHFFATWCGYCDEEFKTLVPMYKSLKGKGLIVLAVSEDGEDMEDVLRTFIKDRNIDFPVLMDIDGKVADIYHSAGLPESIFISPDGIIMQRVPGAMNWMTDDAKQGMDSFLSNKGDK